MKLKFVRLNLQETLILRESRLGTGDRGDTDWILEPVGAIHEHNKTIFLKRGGYYDEVVQQALLDQIQIYMGCDISKMRQDSQKITWHSWTVRHSPDSFGLCEWSEFSQSHESIGEISYRNLPQREKDARRELDPRACKGC